MACSTSPAMLSAHSLLIPSQTSSSLKKQAFRWGKGSSSSRLLSVSASTADDSDCNVEECAPDKEVGKVSMEWLAGDKTKVSGTFPPKKKGWTGYVEKDTAGQTNIYSVEPAVYVAESAISSGSAGTSSEGAENTAAIAAGLALISVAAASSILLQVDKNKPQVRSVEYSGPPLSYYISKFQPANIVEASVIPEPQTAPSVEASAPTEATDTPIVETSTPSETPVASDVQF
ncbi:uncharacterized protein M6B38_285975 [Iris pallida]|uniref:Proline-rich family protein n=1 Tax=Iris pallida TaxID=29817 RepID=A0AAX6I096_IRIPA|nr:Uncharacterized protein M6B38_242130 [Iris pallida]KAJ6845875.1 uncharacterized protein M6B38_285975 [Iris pallida]